MRPIPKQLLIHTATLYHVTKEDRWGQETLDAGTQLRYIRVEPSSQVVRDKNNAEIQLAATLFYDCRYSQPREIVWKVDDVVIFHNVRHSVQLVEPLYDGETLHHVEVGLIKHA